MISTITQRIVYSGNGVTTAFAVPFRYDEKSWIWAFVLPSLTQKVLDTDYTLSTAGADNGGTLTFTTAPATGTNNVIIFRVTPLTQLNALPNEGPFPSRTIERQALDKLEMQIQDIYEILGRAVKFPATSIYKDIPLPDPESGKLLSWNGALTAIVNASVGNLALTTPVVIVAIGAAGTTAAVPHSLGSASAKLIGWSATWHTTLKVVSVTSTQINVEFGTQAPAAGGTLTTQVSL